jgi:hypothetical protein
MRQALRTSDTNAALQLIAPDARTAYRNDLQRFQIFVGTGSQEPEVWMWRGKVRVVPERKFHWGIIPGGHAVEMVKTNGEWFLTGRVFID